MPGPRYLTPGKANLLQCPTNAGEGGGGGWGGSALLDRLMHYSIIPNERTLRAGSLLRQPRDGITRYILARALKNIVKMYK